MTDDEPEAADPGAASAPPPMGTMGTGGTGGTGDAGASPYRNLWVPLVVVPFLVVGVLVLVFLFFGAIRGREATMHENLQSVVHGGTNERKQAALGLVLQVMQNHEAAGRGATLPHAAGPDFLGELQGAWKATDEDDNLLIRLALARVLVVYQDPGAREKLTWFLGLSEEQDPDGQFRFGAMEALGMLRDPAAAPAVIPFLDHPDRYLQQAAAAALQTMPSPASVAALEGVLGDPSLELRGMAAISLSHLGSGAGATVLIDLIDAGTYERARAADPSKYGDAALVQNNRIRAVEALARLGRSRDRSVFERLVADDRDPAVREAAMRALADPREETGG